MKMVNVKSFYLLYLQIFHKIEAVLEEFGRWFESGVLRGTYSKIVNFVFLLGSVSEIWNVKKNPQGMRKKSEPAVHFPRSLFSYFADVSSDFQVFEECIFDE